MLADNLENWAKRERQEGVQQGMQQGINAGRIDTLRNQIKLKFGEVPVWADQRLQQASYDELNHWVEQILVADSLDVLFSG